MPRARDRRRGLLAARGAVLAGLLVAAVGLVVRQGSLLVHSCVPGDGATGWLGLRLALLRADVECPAGTLAVGGDRGQVMGVVVMVALPVLVSHLAGLGIGLGLLAQLTGVLRAAREVLASVLPHLPRGAGLPAAPVTVPLTAPSILVPVVRALEAPWRRGPPVLGLA
ncbi:MAG: hypothetical protein JWP95_1817 [Actinotalea sp.]|nr:hypothetical protein [Actinotalea sp.]